MTVKCNFLQTTVLSYPSNDSYRNSITRWSRDPCWWRCGAVYRHTITSCFYVQNGCVRHCCCCSGKHSPSLSFSMFIGVFLSLFHPLCIFPFSQCLSLSCRSPLCLYPTLCTCSLPGLQRSGVESNSSYRYTVRWSIRLRAPQVHKPCGRTTVQAAGNNEKYLAAQYLPRTHIINARVV